MNTSNYWIIIATLVVIALILFVGVARYRALKKLRVPDQPIKVLAFGGSSSGKTILLASLFRTLGLGGAAGVQLDIDKDSKDVLVRWASEIEKRAANLPPATLLGDMTDFHFTFRVTGDGGTIGWPCKISYIDYAGELSDIFEDFQEHQQGPAEQFMKEYEQCDILMGVLDGARILGLLDDMPDDTIVSDLNKMFQALVGAERKTIHLILTKWDKLYSSGYSLQNVVDRLDRMETYSNFIKNPGRGVMRLIPVSSFGLNGYLYEDEHGAVHKTDNPQLDWRPYNVTVPLAWSLRDVLATNWRRAQGNHSSAGRRLSKVKQFSPFFVLAGSLLSLIHFHIPLLHAVFPKLMELEFTLVHGSGELFRKLDEEPGSLRSSLRHQDQQDLVTLLQFLHTVSGDGTWYEPARRQIKL